MWDILIPLAAAAVGAIAGGALVRRVGKPKASWDAIDRQIDEKRKAADHAK